VSGTCQFVGTDLPTRARGGNLDLSRVFYSGQHIGQIYALLTFVVPRLHRHTKQVEV
jgi:hypothetical protein